MKNKLEQLKENFEKLRTVGEMYEELMSKEVADKKELEEAVLRYKSLKKQALKISHDSKKLIQKIESEDMP